MQNLQSGTSLQRGKYHIEKVLGQGGFGITYLATQKIVVEGSIGEIEMEIKVAIKEFFMKDVCNREEKSSIVTIPSVGSRQLTERFRTKFVKEARNIAKLKHPNIIKVVDVFEENNTAYYVMEYHNNGSLSNYIKENGILNEDEALLFVQQIADALFYIHKQQMNHLDIKPDNVLLSKSGEAILIDFGLSKCYNADGEQTSTTPMGVSVGYAPLEQSRVGGVGTFSPATDIYSLGATLYKMVTGQTPPDASVVLDEGVPDMPDGISDDVQNAIRKAMEPIRKKRPQNISDFLSLLPLKKHQEEKDVNDQNVATEVFVVPDQRIITQNPSIEMGEETLLVGADGNSFGNINFILINKGITELDALTAVDLGLSVRWGTRNMGALCTADKGELYGWGDVEGNNTTESFYLDNKPFPNDISGTEYDIVTHRLGKDWSIPSVKQWEELVQCCKWEWVELPSIAGYVITGRTHKKIFLPCAGRRYGTSVYFSENYGYYWSGMINEWNRHEAHYCFFNRSNIDVHCVAPYYVGRSIRGVKK